MTQHAVFKFCLFIAGETSNSVQALANLHALCRSRLPHRHEIEVVDVFTQPKRALAQGVFLTPTLIKLTPHPSQRIVGTLGDAPTVLRALGLESITA